MANLLETTASPKRHGSAVLQTQHLFARGLYIADCTYRYNVADTMSTIVAYYCKHIKSHGMSEQHRHFQVQNAERRSVTRVVSSFRKTYRGIGSS